MSYNYETKRDSPNFTPASQARAQYAMDRVIEGITIHHWGDPANNPAFDGIVNYLCRVGGNTSIHWVATGTGRRVACLVAPTDIAWHGGTAWANARTVGIELDPRARDEDYDVAAELIADIRSAFGDIPIYWHSYFIATACPGRWDPDRLDKLSYTKFSHATDWGKGGDINPKAPTPAPVPPAPPATSSPVWYKLSQNGKQVAAYSTEANAYKGLVERGMKGTITFDGKDITPQLVIKFTQPSPTTKDPQTGQPLPDTGKPVTEKHDYSEENNNLLKQILALVQSILDKLKSIFK